MQKYAKKKVHAVFLHTILEQKKIISSEREQIFICFIWNEIVEIDIKENKGTFWGDEMLYILTMVMDTIFYSFFQNLPTCMLK